MKNTFKVLGIIAIVAIIGFSMAACGGDDGGGSSGGGLDARLFQARSYAGFEFSDSNNNDLVKEDFTVAVNGAPVTIISAARLNTTIGGSTYYKKQLLFTVSPSLTIGQSYSVSVAYNGSDSGLRAKFPYSGNLTCKNP